MMAINSIMIGSAANTVQEVISDMAPEVDGALPNETKDAPNLLLVGATATVVGLGVIGALGAIGATLFLGKGSVGAPPAKPVAAPAESEAPTSGKAKKAQRPNAAERAAAKEREAAKASELIAAEQAAKVAEKAAQAKLKAEKEEAKRRQEAATMEASDWDVTA